MTAPKTLSLVAKLAAILGEMEAMKKDGKNAFHGYAYFTEGQMMAELRQKLSSRSIWLSTGVTGHTVTPIQNSKGATEQLVTVDTMHTFRDGDSGEEIGIPGFGMGVDTSDKGGYKAITGAVKYCLMKAFFVTDSEDPENDANLPPPTAAQKEPEKHSPHKPYESAKAPETPAGENHLRELKAWLNAAQIPEEFALTLAKKGGMADWENTLDECQPGTIARLYELRQKGILARWKEQTDTGHPAETSQDARHEAVADGKTSSRGGQSEAAPDGNARKREYSLDGGDRGSKQKKKYPERKPCQDDVAPEDILRQEGLGWRDVTIHFSEDWKGTRLGDLNESELLGWLKWQPKLYRGKLNVKDILMDAALCVASKQ